MRISNSNITAQQLELLKSFRYLTNEDQINEVKELLHLYYTTKLDAAIEKEEVNRNYTAEVYQIWLNRQRDSK